MKKALRMEGLLVLRWGLCLGSLLARLLDDEVGCGDDRACGALAGGGAGVAGSTRGQLGRDL
jgi:hypothetical protein